MKVKHWIKIILVLLLLLVCSYTINSQTSTVDNAKFINQSVPDRMTPGESYTLILTFENTGTTYWSPGEYRIRVNTVDIKPSSLWSVSEMDLVKIIEPGNTATFEVKVTAPSTEGVYPFKAELIHGSYVFGESSNPINISVSRQSGSTNDLNGSAFVEQTIPSVMEAGRSYKVSISMTNIGKTTWIAGNYRLVMLDASGNALTGGNWNAYSVSIDRNIEPGGSKVFNFEVMPLQEGTYTLQWRMAAGDAGLFGDATKTAVVTVKKVEVKKNEGKNGKQ